MLMSSADKTAKLYYGPSSFRVLRPEGTLIFKWCEYEVPVREVLALTPEKPLFGHQSGKLGKTHWIAFLKPNSVICASRGPVCVTKEA